MSEQNSVVQFGQINQMLDNDPEYFKEFCEAALRSFGTFQRDFKIHMQNRDLENLRKVGHRIKPAAQMLGIHKLVDEYNEAKNLLQSDADMKKIEVSIQRVDALCDQILAEFNNKIH